ncbi:MAG: type II secretion system F family protein [Armatimonadetes bacterium]|nr:type II secretion system F family protein [Armatimonadota bacterium]
MTEETDRHKALLRFTLKFAALIESGVSLARSFEIFEKETPSLFADGKLKATLLEGYPLSVVFADRPDFLSPFYLKMVRVGEIGGILDETLGYMADWLEEEWKLYHLTGRTGRVWLLSPSAALAPESWNDLNEPQRLFTLMLFCEALGTMLSAGVPPELALETASELLPAQQQAALKDGDKESLAGLLARAAFLPPLAASLVAIGEGHDLLPETLDRAARLYRRLLRCEIAGAGGRNAVAFA